MDRTIDAFRGAGHDGSQLDIEWMKKGLANKSVCQQALDHISNPAFVGSISKTLSEKDVNNLKRAIYRSCISHGIPLPSRCVINARMLGVVVV
jgi:CRISPR/Cas system-associated endoribonuclease Cas2